MKVSAHSDYMSLNQPAIEYMCLIGFLRRLQMRLTLLTSKWDGQVEPVTILGNFLFQNHILHLISRVNYGGDVDSWHDGVEFRLRVQKE